MKYLIFSLLFVEILHAKMCEMQIKEVKNNATQFMLTLTHDKTCEVMMDESNTKIVLISKPIDVNISEKTSSLTSLKDVDRLLSLAKSKLGDSYVYAAAGPDHFDCSGFVYYVFKENGISIPRSSLPQSQSGKKLIRAALKKGDILFFDTHERGHINHSGIYLGDGKFIHSSSGKAYGVTISDLDKGFYKDKFRWGVRKSVR